MLFVPFHDMSKRTFGKFPFDYSARNINNDLKITVPCMEVRRIMIVKIHKDHDS